jgi:hypothetical protein
LPSLKVPKLERIQNETKIVPKTFEIIESETINRSLWYFIYLRIKNFQNRLGNWDIDFLSFAIGKSEIYKTQKNPNETKIVLKTFDIIESETINRSLWYLIYNRIKNFQNRLGNCDIDFFIFCNCQARKFQNSKEYKMRPKLCWRLLKSLKAKLSTESCGTSVTVGLKFLKQAKLLRYWSFLYFTIGKFEISKTQKNPDETKIVLKALENIKRKTINRSLWYLIYSLIKIFETD